MMATEQQILAFLQTPGLSDQQIATELNRIGATAQQVSNVTGVPVAEVQQRIAAASGTGGGTAVVGGGGTTVGGGGGTVTRTGPTFATTGETQLYNFLQTPGLTDDQIRAEINRLGVTAQQVSSMTGVPLDQVQSRIAGTGTTTRTTTGTGTGTTTTGTTTTGTTTTGTNTGGTIGGTNTNLTQFENWLRSTPGLTDAQILAEMNRLGVSGGQVAGITGMPINQVQNRISNLLPFSNATQGFSENFRNYTSIPIGAQYNPNVTGGLSPYGQVMGQMQPLTNPYAAVRSGLSMGGYDPTIYDQNLLSNFVQQRADDAAANRAEQAAAQLATEMGGFNGGLITKVMGPKPPTPDDGMMFVQKGEYIVKKDAVNKYGKGLLDKVNEGKIPAGKMKSLLG